ncbi:MAG: translation initiation factor IF-6 [Euryarchaeota archaeon]|nr:translation initiation factor IF-6 [Euryarchaeota archaeon]
MLLRADYNSNPSIGTLAAVNDSVAVVPQQAPEEFVSTLREALEVEVVTTSICGTSLVGVFLAMNNHGAIVCSQVERQELRVLQDAGIEVEVVEERHNALGNLILASDSGALVYSELGESTKEAVERVMGCRVHAVASLGGYRTVGSIGAANSRGVLLHPSLSEEELKLVESTLGVRAEVGTVNMGVGFVATGMLVNSKGAVVGSETTGVEMMRIQDVFELS